MHTINTIMNAKQYYKKLDRDVMTRARHLKAPLVQ